jgi:hypothetical protein
VYFSVTFLKDIAQQLLIFNRSQGKFCQISDIPINIDTERMTSLAQTFGCSMGSLPFTYLGLPLGLSKPKVDEYLPLVSKCERRLASFSTFLSQAGRLQMTNVVLSSLPISTSALSSYKTQ